MWCTSCFIIKSKNKNLLCVSLYQSSPPVTHTVTAQILTDINNKFTVFTDLVKYFLLCKSHHKVFIEHAQMVFYKLPELCANLATQTIYRACHQASDTVMYPISGRRRRAEIQTSHFIRSLAIDFNKPNILSCISWLHIQSSRPGASCLSGRPFVRLPISMRIKCKA